MSMDIEKEWIDAIAALGQSKSSDWAKAFADAIDQRVSNKAGLTTIQGAITFTFNKDLFAQGLLGLTPDGSAVSAMTKYATVWADAMMASQIVVAPGSYVGTTSPATLWSVVASSLLDPPSIQSAKEFLIQELANLPVADQAKDSKFGPTFRKAFLMCTASVQGLDSTPTPAGPLPLSFPLDPLS